MREGRGRIWSRWSKAVFSSTVSGRGGQNLGSLSVVWGSLTFTYLSRLSSNSPLWEASLEPLPSPQANWGLHLSPPYLICVCLHPAAFHLFSTLSPVCCLFSQRAEPFIEETGSQVSVCVWVAVGVGGSRLRISDSAFVKCSPGNSLGS